jgi:DNA-binding transcriptional regulator WhiA
LSKDSFCKSSYPDFKKDENLAELIDLVLGDGNLYQHERTERLLIAFNSKYPKIIERGRKLIFAHFGKKPAIFYNKTKTCTKLSLYEKKIGIRLGIPVGNKRRFNLYFPSWIWDSKETILSCLLGLYNAEGSLSVYRPSRAYIMSFSNNNKTLLEDVFRALKMLKYNPNLRTNKVNLRRRKEILGFCQQIRFFYYRGSNYCRVE